MRTAVHHTFSATLTLVLVLSALITGTLGWQSLSQQAKNEVAGGPARFEVQLIKLEKAPQGTETTTPVPGATFYLFTEDGQPQGTPYRTGADGTIHEQLAPGAYYFEEAYPAPGYTFDVDPQGNPITRYPFTITGRETEPLVVTACNRPLQGALTLQKYVQNPDGSPLTRAQQQQAFTFTVHFSDNGTYPCTIDGSAPQPLASGATLSLKHGQTARFENLPVGLLYTINETPIAGYHIRSTGHRGNITEAGCTAIFTNTAATTPAANARLLITKEVIGSNPPLPEEQDQVFGFTLIIDGQETRFTLKAGQTRAFDLPAGAIYDVREDNAYPDGYSQTIRNGTGTAEAAEINVIATNTLVGPAQVAIEGIKTWDLGSAGPEVLPEAITVRLKKGRQTIAEQTVRPDENHQWQYRFIAPKYAPDGQEIQYTIEEVPLENFQTTHDGYNLKNTYRPPVTIDPPVIEKVTTGENPPQSPFQFLFKGAPGAPMPEGSRDGKKWLTLNGAGTVELGEITFTQAGNYTYTVTEQDSGTPGWTYDQAVYTLSITVTEEAGALKAEKTLEKNRTPAQSLQFTNHYTKTPDPTEPLEIQGTKTWHHRDNPKANQPQSIIVYVYANGEPIIQRQVTAQDNWQYHFELPPYTADGQPITYTIGEAEVPHYETQIEGFNLINTYVRETQPTETPAPDTATGDPPGESPDTGNAHHPFPWLILMVTELACILVSLRLGKEDNQPSSHQPKRRKP